mmetsp:Transcript_6366/g.14128  ORF Transcript_6366/g.14128 Transcript_6366/m.14128 type:complete len:304 (+) Transcript_6366:2786-3697(+)
MAPTFIETRFITVREMPMFSPSRSFCSSHSLRAVWPCGSSSIRLATRSSSSPGAALSDCCSASIFSSSIIIAASWSCSSCFRMSSSSSSACLAAASPFLASSSRIFAAVSSSAFSSAACASATAAAASSAACIAAASCCSRNSSCCLASSASRAIRSSSSFFCAATSSRCTWIATLIIARKRLTFSRWRKDFCSRIAVAFHLLYFRRSAYVLIRLPILTRASFLVCHCFTFSVSIGTSSSMSISASSSRARPVPAFMKSLVRPSWYLSFGTSTVSMITSKKPESSMVCMNFGRYCTTRPWIIV